MLEKLPASFGRALHGRRAGLEKVVLNRLMACEPIPSISLQSSAFLNGRAIPPKYTADGSGLSPPLRWTEVPATGTESIAVIVEDPDAPSADPLVHAIVVNLPPHTTSLEEGALQSAGNAGLALHTGRNSYLTQAWLPPDPPPGHGSHRYVFQVFALGRGPAFSKAPGRREFFDRLLDRALAGGCLMGTYERV